MCTSGLRGTLSSVRWLKPFPTKLENKCLPSSFFSMEFVLNPIKLPKRYFLLIWARFDICLWIITLSLYIYIYEKRKEFAAWPWRRRWNWRTCPPDRRRAQLLCAIRTILVISTVHTIFIFILIIFIIYQYKKLDYDQLLTS